MSKKYFILFAITVLFSSCAVLAETNIQQIQSPIYTDEIGRSHFMGKGGYSAVNQTHYTEAAATDIPVSSRSKTSFSTQDRQAESFDGFGYSSSGFTHSGVNDSKTIYTDDLGRLHFFGKRNN